MKTYFNDEQIEKMKDYIKVLQGCIDGKGLICFDKEGIEQGSYPLWDFYGYNYILVEPNIEFDQYMGVRVKSKTSDTQSIILPSHLKDCTYGIEDKNKEYGIANYASIEGVRKDYYLECDMKKELCIDL